MHQLLQMFFKMRIYSDISFMFRNIRLIYITTGSTEEARKIGKILVEEKLAACANIVNGMESIYHWKGKIESDSETILICKTTYSNVRNLTERVKKLHSYDVPCVISLNVSEQEGNEDYLDWIIDSVINHTKGDPAHGE